MRNFTSIAIAVVALGVGLFAMTNRPQPVQPAQQYGAVGSPDVYQKMYFHDVVTNGGGVLATSSVGTATYTAANIANNRLIEHIAASALTATLPSKTALTAVGFLPTAGDTYSIFIHASTTGITLAGGTGDTLNSASSSKMILAGTTARLDFVKLPASEGSGYWVTMYSADQ